MRRAKVAEMLLQRDYIPQLVQLFETAEDLESAEDLAHLFTIFKGLVMLNSTNVYEVLLPFFADEPLPRALARTPPPVAFRRRATPTHDRSLMGATLEGVSAVVCKGCASTHSSTIRKKASVSPFAIGILFL
mgnify:CR=1 FL=1